jgi:NMD protein affecting ribosome stability and mRNA decay
LSRTIWILLRGESSVVNQQKRYTNQTFTKRVDHEGGLHRPARKLAEPAACEKCGALYADGRWVDRDKAHESAQHENWRPSNRTTCPACKQIENHSVGGYVSISGEFLLGHRAEIENLVDNEAERAREDNPLSRIMTRQDDSGRVIIETTTEHLAQRLGRALKKAFDGEVSYDFSHENKVARVTWHRD